MEGDKTFLADMHTYMQAYTASLADMHTHTHACLHSLPG